jgi:hypothetical protein
MSEEWIQAVELVRVSIRVWGIPLPKWFFPHYSIQFPILRTFGDMYDILEFRGANENVRITNGHWRIYEPWYGKAYQLRRRFVLSTRGAKDPANYWATVRSPR